MYGMAGLMRVARLPHERVAELAEEPPEVLALGGVEAMQQFADVRGVARQERNDELPALAREVNAGEPSIARVARE